MRLSSFEIAKPTKANIMKLYDSFGYEDAFSHTDIMKVTGLTATPASTLVKKLKNLNLVESTPNAGRGKYKLAV